MNDTPTPAPEPTTEAAAPTGPSVPMEAVMERYARELAVMTQRALVAEALVAQGLSERADGVS